MKGWCKMEFLLIILWLVTALATIQVYSQRGHSVGFGALVGFLLGPLGLLVALTKPDLNK